MNGVCSGIPGGTCSFSCNTCYTLVGQQVLKCENGVWNDGVPQCNLISCQKLIPPSNGRMSGQCDPGICGSECTFSCNYGYILRGSATIRCSENGQWSSTPASCIVITCVALVKPNNGDISGTCSPGVPGSSCLFSCDTGFVLNGVNELRCRLDGQWSAHPPQCVQIHCPPINKPNVGSISGSCINAVPGDKCIYGCPSGYQLIGVSILTCQVTGQWSNDGQGPVCGKICAAIGNPVGGMASSSCLNPVVGSECVITCSPKFKLIGESKIICQMDGSWSSFTPTCRRTMCDDLSVSYGGIWISECREGTTSCPTTCFGSPNQRCTLICGRGYTLVGSATTTCDPATLEWKPNPPICRQDSQ
ncbi:P-selectin-like protein [Dinothrombium tinctorium]|uniref:P-selectin-like protein n=2 Tax=Dinothrombium tinctorium TaxID=1965070 RepID=A0A3S3NHK3_9ACAR|nr:P-selectin-like protein [Dinothrombium tinctorium]